jgi:hypothetical protein
MTCILGYGEGSTPRQAEFLGLAMEIIGEVERADDAFPPMNSPHEAMAVILEEYTEYQSEVFKHNTSKPGRDTRPWQREELIQLAAMCLRAILDTIDNPKEGK